MLALVAAAFATPYALPITAVYTEETGWGLDPVVVDDVLTATVAISNPATGAKFPTYGELTLRDRSGAGSGELALTADPSGSVRTWAIYLLDGDGNLIGKEPEVVEVLFGKGGTGAIVARESADVAVRALRVVPATAGSDDGTHVVEVEVQGIGTQAAYVGIQELAADKGALAPHVDLGAMTAGVYAAYQGLALDAIVPLEAWRATVQGVLAVDGVTVSKAGMEDGAELDYAVTFQARDTSDDRAAVVPLATVTYAKGGGGRGPKPKQETTTLGEISALAGLRLAPPDQSPGIWSAAFEVVIDGDARDVELGALFGATSGGTSPLTAEALALDPSDVAIGGTAQFDAAKLPPVTTLTGAVVPLDADGAALAEWSECTFTPVTSDTKDALYVGECLRGDDGRQRVRGLSLSYAGGVGTLSAEVLGLDGLSASKLAFVVDGEGGVSVTAPVEVSETTFALDVGFPEDVDNQSLTFELLFWGLTEAPSFDVVDQRAYDWLLQDDVVYAVEDGAVSATGSAKLKLRDAGRTVTDAYQDVQ